MIQKTLNRRLPGWAKRRINRALTPFGLNLPSSSKHVDLRENAYEAQVVSIRHESGRALSFEFELLGGYRLNYRAGQYVNVTLPVGPVLFQRCYSLSSAPHEPRYTLTVQKTSGGRVSGYLKQQLQVGDKFFIDHPQGDFVLPELHPEEQRYVMVAGGIGIVPIYSLIKDLLTRNPDADIQLVYASRSLEQAVFLKHLEKMANKHPGFSLRTQYTRRFDMSHDPYRRLNGDKIISRLIDPGNALIYLCGPSGLLNQSQRSFTALGVPAGKIYQENFSAAPKSSLFGQLKPHSLSFMPSSPIHGRLSHLRQPQVETVLASANRGGILLQQNCTNGSCGSCKLQVKSGSVLAIEPNGLTMEQAAAGYILPCVSYPCESLLVKLPSQR